MLSNPLLCLGRFYRDRVTGFAGAATGVCVYLSSHTRVEISARVQENGNAQPAQWFDLPQLEPLGLEPITLAPGPLEPSPPASNS